MALKLKQGEVPKSAVILTQSEAISYQWKQIMEWKPKSEIWPFIHGLGILGGVAALSGTYINLRFRKPLKLRNYGAFTSVAATSVCPGLMAFLFQMRYVTEKIFLPIETCPLCIEMRSIVVQNTMAIAYPMVLVPVTNFMLAIRAQTHRVPHYKNWRELLRFIGYLYKPMLPSLAVIGVANSIAASFILYKQLNCLSYMRAVLNMDNEDTLSGEKLNHLS